MTRKCFFNLFSDTLLCIGFISVDVFVYKCRTTLLAHTHKHKPLELTEQCCLNTECNERLNKNTTSLLDSSDDSTSSQRFVDCQKQHKNIHKDLPIHDYSMECKGTSMLLNHSHCLLPNVSIIFKHQTHQTNLFIFSYPRI